MDRYKTQLACILLFLLPVSAHAKIFTVNTFSDEVDTLPGDERCLSELGTCSLRAAIQESNALAGTHTIKLDKGTYYLSLNGREENDSASGDLDIKTNIFIEGSGAANTFISAAKPVGELQVEGIDRVFDINNALVTLKDLSVTHGKASIENESEGGIGGGIRVLNSTLNLDNVWLYANTAGLGVGGGIFSVNSTLNIEHSAIHLNYATAGAGIALLNSKTSINKSFFYGAVGAKNQAHMGGGIYNNGELTISKTAFYRNSVKLDGGAIYHERGNLRMSNSTFNSNRADRNGGAIYYRMGTIDETKETDNTPELRHVTITFNHAYNLAYTEQNLELAHQLRTIDLTQFESMETDGRILFNLNASPEDPQATTGGGGISIAKQAGENSAPLRIANSIIANNTYDVNELVLGRPVWSETFLGDCAKTTTSDIISLGGNIESSRSCEFTHTFDISPVDPGDLNLGPMSSNGMLFSENNDYASLLNQNQFNKLNPPVQLYPGGSPIRNSGIAAQCLQDDQLDKIRVNCDIGAYEYSPPNASPALYVVLPIQSVAGMFATPGPALIESASYHIVSEPDISKGVFFHPDPSSPNWKFTANSGATGNAEVIYKVCSQLINECSTDATIRFSIVTNPANTVSISLEASSGSPIASNVEVFDEVDLMAGSKDADYSFPIGAMFFNVTGVPDTGFITVKLQLPLDNNLEDDTIDQVQIRKFDTSGNWKNLSSEQRPGVSSGQYDHASKIITLRLVDSDAFDLNPEIGTISGPVALGIPRKTDEADTIQITGAGGSLNLLIIYALFFGFVCTRKIAALSICRRSG